MGDPSQQAKAIFLAAIEDRAPEQWPAFLEPDEEPGAPGFTRLPEQPRGARAERESASHDRFYYI